MNELKLVFDIALDLMKTPFFKIIVSLLLISSVLSGFRRSIMPIFLGYEDDEDKKVSVPDSVDLEHSELAECFRDDF